MKITDAEYRSRHTHREWCVQAWDEHSGSVHTMQLIAFNQ